MALQESIKQLINELRTHYETNLNNKYVKNILLKLDISLDMRHNMNIILDDKTLYFDSKGTIDDIYSSIRSITYFIKEIKVRVLPNIYSYTGNSFFTSSGNKDPNDKILFQMAVKNYPMNIKLLAKIALNLLKLVYEYDKTNFPKNPAYEQFSNLNEIFNFLEETIKDEKYEKKEKPENSDNVE